ncbi:IS3 family transposase [Spirillospora sp. NPDC050679]
MAVFDGRHRLLHQRGHRLCDGRPLPDTADRRAIGNAARNRKLAQGAIFHSDRGSNYMSAEYGQVLKELGVRQSAGRTGICFDNAMAESFFGVLKNERVSRMTYHTREQARQDITRYIEFWCNRKHLH